MHLTHLTLRHMRNYVALDLLLHPRVNVLIGGNANGKTNIIEAVFFLSEGASFRTSTLSDLIAWGQPQAQIVSQMQRDDLSDDIAAEITPSGKQLFRNSKRIRSRGIPQLTTVLFAPEELLLLKAGPALRRQFLDHLLGQLYIPYRPCLQKYNQALLQHNRLLQHQEDYAFSTFQLQRQGWQAQLIQYGSELMQLRAQGLRALNEFLPGAYSAITQQGQELRLSYAPRYGACATACDSAATAEQLRRAFQERNDDELRRRVTLVGPHRDDWVAHIGLKEVRHFASQGEHRSVVLALKRCEIQMLQLANGYPPILLLDDVASELDSQRNRAFFQDVLNTPGQVFISAVCRDDVKLPESTDIQWWGVERGLIQKL